MTEYTMDISGEAIEAIFGDYDSNIRKIENDLKVHIINREGAVKITGSTEGVRKAVRLMHQLVDTVKHGVEITEQSIDYSISVDDEVKKEDMTSMHNDVICKTVNGKWLRPKTIGQKKYVDQMRKKMVVFGTGPAGTGKTYLAMAMAITAFKNNEVNRIILTRPAIEAGEKLGFLPGDLQSKVDPYLRPLYDALYEIMGAEQFLNNMEKGLIEVAPLAYMRGRTLDNAFIVLDEAQNTTPAQMKMFLTRIGFNSKAVITGDLTQKDLEGHRRSGLDVGMHVLKDIKEIGVMNLTAKDVVRHPLVQKIVTAYEKFEEKEVKKDGYKRGNPKKGGYTRSQRK